MDFKYIAKKLGFEYNDIETLVTIILKDNHFSSINKNKTADSIENDIIDFWSTYCFRASDMEELIEYYDESTADEVYKMNNIFILPSNLLVVIG